MRNISFSLTTDQFLNTKPGVWPAEPIDSTKPCKCQTRRLGWSNLKPGDRLRACRKCMGLKPDEKIDVLGVIEVISAERQLLGTMPDEDCAAEGFPEMIGPQFVEMFIKHMKATPFTEVTVITFRRIV